MLRYRLKNDVAMIHVVCEFQDVFPNEVSSLPPNTEVEFALDFMLGSGPVLVAPYRMTLL